MVGAAIAGVGAVAGGAISAGGAESAASTQSAAQARAQAMAQPFVGYGQTAGGELTNELMSGQLGGPAPLTQAAIENMPGYQFTLGQGLKAVSNASTAQGQGISGAQMKGAADYATGLANQNFQNYFQDYWANQNNRYNMLANLTSTGANAAVGAGTNLVSSANNIAQTQQNATNVLGASVAGAANNPYVFNALASGGSTLGAAVPGYNTQFGSIPGIVATPGVQG